MKVCYKCKIEKELSEFNFRKDSIDGYFNKCRNCANNYQKEYYKKNKSYYRKQYKRNKKKYKEYRINNYIKNHCIDEDKYFNKKLKLKLLKLKKQLKEKRNLTHRKCSVCKEWKEYKYWVKSKSGYHRCKSCNNKMIANSIRKRRKNDHIFQLQQNIRSRISYAFKRKKWNKSSKSQKLLGCDYETLKKHLEKQFQDGMTWENNKQDGWHIDHIIPLSIADNKHELEVLCHYTNLQPLWAKDNFSKSDSFE